MEVVRGEALLMVRELFCVREGVGGTLVEKTSDLSKKMYLMNSSADSAMVTSCADMEG